MNKYIDAEKLRSVLQNTINSMKEKDTKGERYDAFLNGKLSICEELLGSIDSLQQEQPKSKIVKVKCYFPFDDTWEKDKIYTCEVWHHGDLNRDFWDVYYDYGKDARYVQFSSIQRLNEEFAIVNHEQDHLADTSKKEQPKVDLDFEKVWNWIDDTFRETEVNSRYGESRNVLMSGYDMLKSDLREKFERDFGVNTRKEE